MTDKINSINLLLQNKDGTVHFVDKEHFSKVKSNAAYVTNGAGDNNPIILCRADDFRFEFHVAKATLYGFDVNSQVPVGARFDQLDTAAFLQKLDGMFSSTLRDYIANNRNTNLYCAWGDRLHCGPYLLRPLDKLHPIHDGAESEVCICRGDEILIKVGVKEPLDYFRPQPEDKK